MLLFAALRMKPRPRARRCFGRLCVILLLLALVGLAARCVGDDALAKRLHLEALNERWASWRAALDPGNPLHARPTAHFHGPVHGPLQHAVAGAAPAEAEGDPELDALAETPPLPSDEVRR